MNVSKSFFWVSTSIISPWPVFYIHEIAARPRRDAWLFDRDVDVRANTPTGFWYPVNIQSYPASCGGSIQNVDAAASGVFVKLRPDVFCRVWGSATVPTTWPNAFGSALAAALAVSTAPLAKFLAVSTGCSTALVMPSTIATG